VNRLDRHRRQRRPKEKRLPITAAVNGWVIVVPCLLLTVFFSLTPLPTVELPACGRAGNASGQVALPPLSVEIHDDGVTVHEGDTLIETLPWVDDPGLDDLDPVLQQVQATDPEGRVAGDTAGETPHIGRA